MLTKYFEIAKSKEKIEMKPVETKLQKAVRNCNDNTYSLTNVIERIRKNSNSKEPSISELKAEINFLKEEIKELKLLRERVTTLENQLNIAGPSHSNYENEFENLNVFADESNYIDSNYVHAKISTEPNLELTYVNPVNQIKAQKWHTTITIVINNGEFVMNTIAMLDSGADLSCMKEGIIPSKYFEKTTQILRTANHESMVINYKITKSAVCKK